MIGYVRRLVDDLVLTPQADPARGDRQAFLDTTETPLDVEAQELDTLAVRSYPIDPDLTGSVTVRHELSVAVVVAHPDLAEAIRIRDGICLDLVLRARSANLTGQAADPETGQYVTRVDWGIDYRPLNLPDARESAVLTFTLDTELDG